MAEIKAQTPSAAATAAAAAGLRITLTLSPTPGEVHEQLLHVAAGTRAIDVLNKVLTNPKAISAASYGIWGRVVAPEQLLRDGDRLELYRPLTVDPKVARRERFARQGARTTGLFARQRPGGKAGY